MDNNRYSVLLVDDEEDIIRIIMKKLDWESMGLTIIGHAANGVEALEMAEELTPDIVMTDIKMPYMDGLTLCRKLKELSRTIRVIIFSGFDEFEYAKEAIKMEAEEYLLKPVNAVELKEVFERVKNDLDQERAEKRDTEKLKSYYMESLPVLQESLYMALLEGRITSGQIYKYMDIGSAKPTAEEMSQAVHHLIGFLEPDDEFSVADYTELAHKTIADITSRGKIAVMAGGTGLYINSVVNDVTFGEIDTDYELREKLQKTAEEKGSEYLLDMLAEFDKESAERLHPNNVRRIIRAIEFYKTTGKPISKHQEETKRVESRYNPLMICIDWDRDVLYDRINRRVDIMIKSGLLEEVKCLMDMGYTQELNSMKGIGYKEVMDYYDGKMSLEDAVELIKQSSRRYAKRQLTWFRRDDRIHYVSSKNPFEESKKLIDEFLK